MKYRKRFRCMVFRVFEDAIFSKKNYYLKNARRLYYFSNLKKLHKTLKKCNINYAAMYQM